MDFKFYKYQGTGNDFILLDNRSKKIKLNTKQIAKLCNRQFGIGADGLILLEKEYGFDFKMIYYNSNGRISSMCGNGGRCIARFARDIGVIKRDITKFIAIDGEHIAELSTKYVKLKMSDCNFPDIHGLDFIVDTGSPHYIKYVENVETINVIKEGAAIRYSNEFFPNGINVNFITPVKNTLHVRTYERGVENETLSCGTGVIASAVVHVLFNKHIRHTITIHTRGGTLRIFFKKMIWGFTNVYLEGPAQFVFEGIINM